MSLIQNSKKLRKSWAIHIMYPTTTRFESKFFFLVPVIFGGQKAFGMSDLLRPCGCGTWPGLSADQVGSQRPVDNEISYFLNLIKSDLQNRVTLLHFESGFYSTSGCPQKATKE